MLLGLALALATAGIAFALAISDISGTGASDVGSSVTPAAQAPSAPGASDRPPGGWPGADAQTSPRRDCEATESNPGGDNNYIPDAPAVASLGDGFVITGRVRSRDVGRALVGGWRERRRSARSGEWCLIAPDVRLGDDSEEVAILFGDDEAVELVLGHEPTCLVDVLVGTRRHEVLGRTSSTLTE